MRRVIVPRIGDLRLAEATPGRLQAFFTAVTKEHGPGTAKTTRSVLSGILGMAVRADALRTNPVAQVAAIRRGSSRASTALQLESVPAFIDTVVNDAELQRADVGDLLAFMVMSGCRIGEALALPWDRVDLAGREGDVQRDGRASPRQGAPASATRQDRCVDEDDLHSCSGRGPARATGSGRSGRVPEPVRTLRDPVDAESVWRRNRERLGLPVVHEPLAPQDDRDRPRRRGHERRAIAEYPGHSKPSLTQDVSMSRNAGSAAAADHLDRMFGVSSGLDTRPESVNCRLIR